MCMAQATFGVASPRKGTVQCVEIRARNGEDSDLNTRYTDRAIAKVAEVRSPGAMKAVQNQYVDREPCCPSAVIKYP